MKINSHNEWDRLREVIVGTAAVPSAPGGSWGRPASESARLRPTAFGRAASRGDSVVARRAAGRAGAGQVPRTRFMSATL